MKKIAFVSFLVLNLFGSDYIPLSNLSNEQKEEYNFVNKSNEIISDTERIEQKKEEIKSIDKNFVKEYKKDNILKDERKISQANYSRSFYITPKISLMNTSTKLEKEEIGETFEVVPEILFSYKNHNLKFDYLTSDVAQANIDKFNYANFNLDTKWYRVAYLYSLYNANVGIAYNYLKLNGYYQNLLDTKWYQFNNQQFATVEVHLKNSENEYLLEYGGFYGKNADIKNAYEYYLTLGYRVFKNDNLVFSAGYKNRAIEDDDSIKLEYKGPIIGISSKF